MRISETKVCQLIEAEPPFLVVKDDVTGSEAKFFKADLPLLEIVCSFPDWEDPTRPQVTTTAEELPYLAKAVEYFKPHM